MFGGVTWYFSKFYVWLEAVGLRPDSQTIKDFKRTLSKRRQLIGDCNGTFADHCSVHHASSLKFLKALVNHLFAGATKHPRQIVESHGAVFQVIDDGTRPLASNQPHAALDCTGLGARIENFFSAVTV